MNPKIISILGCGWLGFQLGKFLTTQGYHVKGSTTTSSKLPELRKAGIDGYLFALGNPSSEIPADFLVADWLILSLPPAGLSDYAEELTSILRELPDIKVIMISSTAVYPNTNKHVTEKDAVYRKSPHSGLDLLGLEDTIATAGNCTILRLGGLYGPERHPGKFLAGKTELSNGKAPVNLVHLEDVIKVVHEVIIHKITGEVFNVVAGQHPTREEFYRKAAFTQGLVPPQFSENDDLSFKIVDNKKIRAQLSYSFIHDNPMNDL
jgi:nucleoside-diphosphate-sugar epimerase